MFHRANLASVTPEFEVSWKCLLDLRERSFRLYAHGICNILDRDVDLIYSIVGVSALCLASRNHFMEGVVGDLCAVVYVRSLYPLLQALLAHSP